MIFYDYLAQQIFRTRLFFVPLRKILEFIGTCLLHSYPYRMFFENFSLDGKPVHFIDTQEAWNAAAPDALHGCTEIAVDFEFDRNRYRYGFTLCLIQFEVGGSIFVVDPFTVKDLSVLWHAFEDDAVAKLFHGSNEDRELLKELGVKLTNAHDTEIAARLLGLPRIALVALLDSELDVKLDKTEQISNWTTRPLTMSQINYAAYDVVYLRQLHHKLYDAVVAAGREAWYKEILAEKQDEVRQPITEPHLRLKEATKLSDLHQFVLERVYRWRDRLARQWNFPPANVVPNAWLLEWAQKENPTFADWEATRSMYHKVRAERYYKEVADLISEARAEAQASDLPEVWQYKPRTDFVRTREANELIRDACNAVRQALRAEYGEMVTPLLFSATQVEELCKGHSLPDVLYHFALPVVEAKAAELSLDLHGLGVYDTLVAAPQPE